MTTVKVKASSAYNVLIERGLLNRIGEESVKIISPCKAMIISGEDVFPIYGRKCVKELENAGYEVYTFIHKKGEEAKCLEVYAEVLNSLAEARFCRSDAVFALGGGVTGDLAGFSAATYQRGICFIQIPTTLLAAVDSSVGGKTALNLLNAKNQIGCFYQPGAVFCDIDTLSTLDPDQYRCGCAEIIKYGVLGSADLFSLIEKNDICTQEEFIISRCIEMKSDIVCRDEFDRGERKVLNLGHTFGHAIEKCSGFRMLHGDAVAIGMAIVARGAVSHGIMEEKEYNRLIGVLKKYGLPVTCELERNELIRACLSDKKMYDGRMHLVVPERIGKCRIIEIGADDIENWL